MDDETKKAMKRILSLSLIKEDENDDEFDALRKIGSVAFEWLRKHDIVYAELAAHKENRIRDDEAERQALWEDSE
jgi:hypothetical protein